VLGKFPPTTPELCGVATVKIACDFGWTVLALICLIVPKSSSFKCAWKYHADKIIHDKWNANYTRKNLTTCQQDMFANWAEQPCSKLSTSRWQFVNHKMGTSSGKHPVHKLLEQHCYKSAAGLLQLVRFYVCIYGIM
jgi:hypothetical protein